MYFKNELNKFIGDRELKEPSKGLDLESLLSELTNATDFKLREVNHHSIVS